MISSFNHTVDLSVLASSRGTTFYQQAVARERELSYGGFLSRGGTPKSSIYR